MILPALVRHWELRLRDDFEERAAIIEYDARRTRAESERMTEEQIRARESKTRPAAGVEAAS